MALSIAQEDSDHPLSIVDTNPPLASDLKKSLAQSRQQPAPRAQAKLAGIDTCFYDLDLNSDPLQPSDSQVNKVFGNKNTVPTTDGVIALPPQLHFNEHHQHHRHRHEAMTIGDMSEPHLTDSVEDTNPHDTPKSGKKDRKIISSTFTESPMMIDPAELMSHGKGTTKPAETVIDVAESSGTPTTPSATTAVNAGNYPSYSASFFRGWFDLPPSLSGQSPTQRPRLSLSMQGTAPAPLLPTPSSLPPKTPETVDIPLGPMRPVKRDEVYGLSHQETFSLGEDEEDTSAWGMGASSNTERESRRGQMAQ